MQLASPKLLEQIMDADDPNNSILCHCQGPGSIVCPPVHREVSTCSHSSVSCQCSQRPESSRLSSCSKSPPKPPKQDVNSQQCMCLCPLSPGSSGTSRTSKSSQPKLVQSISNTNKMADPGPQRSKQNACIPCLQRHKISQSDTHKHCHVLDTDLEESDVSDSDHISSTVPSTMILTSDCAVCLETYSHGSILCGLPCGHNYHHQCILAWLHRDNHHCPVCRWPAYKTKNLRNHLHQE